MEQRKWGQIEIGLLNIHSYIIIDWQEFQEGGLQEAIVWQYQQQRVDATDEGPELEMHHVPSEKQLII